MRSSSKDNSLVPRSTLPRDCCKPSCAWSRPGLASPVKTCNINDEPLADGVTAQSGCTGGTSYMCSSQSPWAINDNLAYGFAAVSAENPACCTCYKLTFTDTEIKGKTMIVQATNTGHDVSGTQFDLAMPGGGFGLFDGCSNQWKANSSVWGAQYGGSNTNQCSAYPPNIKTQTNTTTPSPQRGLRASNLPHRTRRQIRLLRLRLRPPLGQQPRHHHRDRATHHRPYHRNETTNYLYHRNETANYPYNHISEPDHPYDEDDVEKAADTDDDGQGTVTGVSATEAGLAGMAVEKEEEVNVEVKGDGRCY
ncbi:MAG: hypothetical protein Q9208_004135 [Pyrenodesmia sp. 3 TL-2023]